MKKRKFFILIPLFIMGIVPAVIMLLWNSTLVDLFSLKSISYWQAMGLLILSRILFGNFNFRRPIRPPFADKGFREKWLSTSNEEKNRMKEEWKKRQNNC
jgi:hypothetical protein